MINKNVPYSLLEGLDGATIIEMFDGETQIHMEDGLIRCVDPDDMPDDEYYYDPEDRLSDDYDYYFLNDDENF